MREEIDFEKYKERGAYHWENYFGSVFKIDCFLRGRYDVVISLLTTAGLDGHSKVLEVGCGDGALIGLIVKKFHCKLTGVEPSPEGIRFAREMFKAHKLKGIFEQSQGYSLDFSDNHFDCIVLADVIEHLQYPDLMLKELKRLVKPGGYLAITTPVRTNEHPEDKMHVREFYPEELITLCATCFSDPVEKIFSHPVVWYELYTHGKKMNRSLIRLYCRIMDKVIGANVFFNGSTNRRWTNFKQQGLLLRKRF